jgi:hypothetical protein
VVAGESLLGLSIAKPKAKERPPAPWGSFPLVELLVLAGLGLLVAGFASGGFRSGVLIGAGLALASLGGLELSIREHLAGFRSHTLLLAGAAGVATVALLSVAASGLLPVARVAAGAVVFGAGALLLRRVFQNRSGGKSFKL